MIEAPAACVAHPIGIRWNPPAYLDQNLWVTATSFTTKRHANRHRENYQKNLKNVLAILNQDVYL